jgi:hypothetical protein
MSKKIHKNKKEMSSKNTTDVFIAESHIDAVYSDWKTNLFLYRFVYRSTTSMCVVFVLFISFFIQGIDTVHADEIEGSEPPQLLEESLESTVASVDSLSADQQDIPLIDLPATELTDEEYLEVEESIVTDTSTAESPTEDLTAVLPGSASTTSTTSTVSLEEDQSNENDNELNEVATSGEEVLEEELAPTISEEDEIISVPETNEVLSLTHSDTEVVFNKDECTELATGSYYCLQPDENQLEDALYSAADVDGDLEIFLVKEGVEVQITQNLTDDSAPYYDQNTNTIVWHRMVDDRYQIISYDLQTEEEVQLTSTAENNMEPTRQGKYTVWQRWTNNGWNIILHDGNGEQQITDTTSHNVAPYIHGSLIVWNRHSLSGKKTIEMFDITSETYVTVEDPDGLSVSNPRMVFVYDSLHPNGDIVTKGYDVLARKFIDLGTLPRELPDELPSSDSTGETRALIQAKPNIKSEIEDIIQATSTPTHTPPTIDSTASTTVALTLDMTTGTTTTVFEEAPVTTTMTDMTPFDLVIEPFEPAEATTTDIVDPVYE